MKSAELPSDQQPRVPSAFWPRSLCRALRSRVCVSPFTARESSRPLPTPGLLVKLLARHGKAGQSGTRRDIITEATSDVNSTWVQLSAYFWTEGVLQGTVHPCPRPSSPVGGRLWALTPSVCLLLGNRIEALPNLLFCSGPSRPCGLPLVLNARCCGRPSSPRALGLSLLLAPLPDPAPGLLPKVRGAWQWGQGSFACFSDFRQILNFLSHRGRNV